MSSSTTAPQQERSRAAAGMEQKQAGTQKKCKDVTTGMRQEEAKGTRSGMQKYRAVVQEHQSRNEGHNRSAAGIKQGCAGTQQKRLGANTEGERCMKSAGLQQECRKKRQGVQQEVIRKSE